MNKIEKRIKYYLGDIINNNYKVDLSNMITIKDLINKSDKKILYNYIIPFINLLYKTKNTNKKFSAFFGDISHKLNAEIIVKNRASYNTKSVIIRCMQFNRHWGLYYKPPNDISFNSKINKIFWRGTTTGNISNKGNRFDLVSKWFNSTNIDVGFSSICQNKDNYKKYLKNSVVESEFLKYKYILSIEGNDKDSGLNWKLNSNSVVLMPSPKISSWLMETTLIPNYHYVLLKDDFSDLEEKLLWCNKNQNKCIEIVKNSSIYMKQFSNNKLEEYIEQKVINKYFDIINK